MKAESLDDVVKRLRLYLTTAVLIIGVMGAATAATVNYITKGVREDLNEFSQQQSHRSERDSVRFERIVGVVEVIAAGLIEPDGSPEREAARLELRRRMHVIQSQ